nr:universal stress protein [Candidatus Njordarchaeum guaymaensis]
MVDKKSSAKVLVPVDRSEQSLQAAETAATIAKKTGTAVTVLHVLPVGRPYAGLQAKINIPRYAYAQPYADLGPRYQIPPSVLNELASRLEQEGERIVSDAEAVFKEEKVKVDSITIRGKDPAEAILQQSEKGYGLVVMGAHGENEKEPFALGSVTKNVIRHSKVPTLIAKETSALSNMLVCVDGSEHSMVALDYSAKLAEKMGSKITLLNVQEPLLKELAPQVCTGLGESILTKSMNALKKKKDLTVEKRIECGVTSDSIVEAAEKGKHDLIVLGDKGHSSIRRFALGSVSDDVAHKAKHSVLIVP